jgi:hypothetical protein
LKEEAAMKWTRLVLPVLLVGALAVACGDDDTTGVTIQDLAGTWDATSLELTPDGIPGFPPIDLVQDLGGTITLIVSVNERYMFIADVPPMPVDTIQGDFELDGTSFTLTNDEDPPGEPPLDGTFTLSGDNLSITVEHAEIVDFSQPPDGDPDPALLEGDFVRT